MAQPETRYARAGDADIAYATVGDGPDLVWAYGLMTHLELKWEEPSLAAMLRRLAEFSRLIFFDRRGCGLSDRGDRHLAPTLEERVADIAAVLDAAGSRRASLFGVSEGCALAALFASMYPRRTERIVLYGGISRMVKDAAHPWGLMEPAEIDAAWEPVLTNWGTAAGAAAMVRLIAPSMAGDRDYLAWFARQQRQSLSRDAVVKFMTTVAEYDMDEVFPAVRVPALVLHRAGDTMVPSSSARRVASRIPGAVLVELPGSDHLPYVGDADAVVEATRQFLAGQAEPAPGDRQLITLLATDAPDTESGALVRRHVRRLGGAEIPGREAGCWPGSARRQRPSAAAWASSAPRDGAAPAFASACTRASARSPATASAGPLRACRAPWPDSPDPGRSSSPEPSAIWCPDPGSGSPANAGSGSAACPGSTWS